MKEIKFTNNWIILLPFVPVVSVDYILHLKANSLRYVCLLEGDYFRVVAYFFFLAQWMFHVAIFGDLIFWVHYQLIYMLDDKFFPHGFELERLLITTLLLKICYIVKTFLIK